MNRRKFIVNGILASGILISPGLFSFYRKTKTARASGMKITPECINCGACQPECPNNAIYEGGSNWELDGKTYGEKDAAPSGAQGFWSQDHYYIVPDKCNGCAGIHDSPQCVAVCPVSCVVTG